MYSDFKIVKTNKYDGAGAADAQHHGTAARFWAAIARRRLPDGRTVGAARQLLLDGPARAADIAAGRDYRPKARAHPKRGPADRAGPIVGPDDTRRHGIWSGGIYNRCR